MLILIADDDHAWCKMLSRFLVSCGHEALCAATWRGARALMSERRPDCVLLDGELPDGPAGEFCSAVRAEDSFAGTALLVLSGDESAAGGCRGDGFVLKGTPLKQVLESVTAAVAARRRN